MLEGTPSDDAIDVIATGTTDTTFAFFSFSGREPSRRDAEYIRWHTLDHRPEQYRIAGMRNALRVVSTPACRSMRAASVGIFDAVDHVMMYFFTGIQAMPAFDALANALHNAGRMPLRLPSIGFATGNLHEKFASAGAVIGADVIPWLPVLGVYLIVEDGQVSTKTLVDIPGVAGVWSFSGNLSQPPYASDYRNKKITCCYLDRDPLEVAPLLAAEMSRRWAEPEVTGLLAAPFYTVTPYEWDRYLPH